MLRLLFIDKMTRFDDINNYPSLFTNQELSILKKCVGDWPDDFDSPRN